MKYNFKVGDKVRRLRGSHFGMEKGDIGTIIKATSRTLYFEEFKGGHDAENFELAEISNWRKMLE